MNNNIKEDYVSCKVAKLLKQKGFDIPCIYSYGLNGDLSPTDDNSTIENNYLLYGFAAPTTALVIKWIRENFKLLIIVGNVYNDFSKWAYSISQDSKGLIVAFRENQNKPNDLNKDFFDSIEEAYEAAIAYCLNKLI